MSNKYASSTRYLFVNTEDFPNSGDQINNIRLNLGGNSFESDDDSLIRMSLTQFNMPKNFYNINDTNNCFRLIQTGFTSSNRVVDDTDVLVKIPAGDYLTFRQLQQAFCDQLKIALDGQINTSGSGQSMTYTVAPNGAETIDYGANIPGIADSRINPILSAEYNRRLLGITITASHSAFRYDNPIIIHSLHISPTEGTKSIGGTSLTADEQFNDSAMLFGGNRTKVFNDATSDSDADMTANNCFSISVPNSNHIAVISGYYPMNTALHTLPYIYVRVNTVVNSTTSNFENVSHNHTASIVPSHILAKIERKQMPDGSVYYRTNDEVVYENYITQNRLNDLQFSITDDKGRVIPQNNLGINMGIFAGYTTSSKKINLDGNLFSDFTLKLERIPIPFAPNILQGHPDPIRQNNNLVQSNVPENRCIL